MSDVNLMTPQLVSGAAILLSFFAGYKYALRVVRSRESPVSASSAAPAEGAESLEAQQVRTINRRQCSNSNQRKRSPCFVRRA